MSPPPLTRCRYHCCYPHRRCAPRHLLPPHRRRSAAQSLPPRHCRRITVAVVVAVAVRRRRDRVGVASSVGVRRRQVGVGLSPLHRSCPSPPSLLTLYLSRSSGRHFTKVIPVVPVPVPVTLRLSLCRRRCRLRGRRYHGVKAAAMWSGQRRGGPGAAWDRHCPVPLEMRQKKGTGTDDLQCFVGVGWRREGARAREGVCCALARDTLPNQLDPVSGSRNSGSM